MPLACVGLSYHTTPVAIREQLAFGREDARQLLTALDREQAWAAGIGEVALVSTCNRTELYVASRGPTDRFSGTPHFAVDLLLGSHGLTLDPVRPYLFARTGSAAVAHLCRVASGLDSMVVGESEVLGQVVTAHGLAADAGTTGLILDAAFRAAIRAGRRARAETGISRAATSVASEALRLVETLVDPASRPTVVLVGAGQMARLLAEILTRRGFDAPVIVGRTASRAADLARAVGGRSAPWEELTSTIRTADVVLSSTSAPHAVLTQEMVAEAMQGRTPGRPLYCLDLAVPRDIDPGLGSIEGVTLHDLDHLQARIEHNRRQRESERPGVEAIIEQEVAHFLAWLHGAELRPLLSAMHARGEEIRRQEIARIMRKLPDADPAVREVMDRLSRSIIAKLLHGPSARLRTETDPERCHQYANALQDLFGLPPDGDQRFAGLP
jgi:glutamyl-tRNA reductase